MNIGDWVRRLGRSSPFHLVDSFISGDVVSRCGRRLLERNYKGLGFAVWIGPAGNTTGTGKRARPEDNHCCQTCLLQVQKGSQA